MTMKRCVRGGAYCHRCIETREIMPWRMERCMEKVILIGGRVLCERVCERGVSVLPATATIR